jgi:hypothetical protein
MLADLLGIAAPDDGHASSFTGVFAKRDSRARGAARANR